MTKVDRPGRPPAPLLLAVLLMAAAAGGTVVAGGESDPAPAAHCTEGRAEDMCWIPPGGFWMGRTRLWLIDEIGWQTRDRVDARPVHRVILPGFWMDRTEVTQRAYREFTKARAHPEPFHWRQGFPAARADFPIYNVSWQEASDYCAFRGKRLPTEAEWEKAARGGLDGAAWPWGRAFRPEPEPDAPPDAPRPRPPARVAHPASPTATGSFAANGFGLHDMVGNIAEWVQDGYDVGHYAVSAIEDPIGPEDAPYRVFRGGSWADTDERIASVFYRNFTRSDTRIHTIGFRCVLEPRQQEPPATGREP